MACELGILNTNLPLALINTTYSWQIPFDALPTYVSMTGVLPAGITLDTTNIILHGTPTESGIFGINISLKANGCINPTVVVPLTLVVLATEQPLVLDMEPLPSCVQKGISYNIPVHVSGGIGPYILTLSPTVDFGSGFGIANFPKPEYTAIEQITTDDAILHFNIANAGTYYVEIDVVDKFGMTAKLIVALPIADFCAVKPEGVLGTSAKSAAVMVKESWHQTSMINFLPEVLRK